MSFEGTVLLACTGMHCLTDTHTHTNAHVSAIYCTCHFFTFSSSLDSITPVYFRPHSFTNLRKIRLTLEAVFTVKYHSKLRWDILNVKAYVLFI